MKNNNEQFEKCLKCKYLDQSDMPNLFCNLTYDLVNDGDFTVCPKDPKSVVNFINEIDSKSRGLEHKLNTYSKIGTVNELDKWAYDDNDIHFEVSTESEELKVYVYHMNKELVLTQKDLATLATLKGVIQLR